MGLDGRPTGHGTRTVQNERGVGRRPESGNERVLLCLLLSEPNQDRSNAEFSVHASWFMERGPPGECPGRG